MRYMTRNGRHSCRAMRAALRLKKIAVETGTGPASVTSSGFIVSRSLLANS